MHKVIWNKQDSYMKKMKLKNLQTNLKTIMNYKEFKINLELSHKDTTSDYKVMKIEQELTIVQKKMKALMNLNDFDLHPIDNKDVEKLAEYADIMFFDSFTARRLISNLAARIIEQQHILDEINEAADA